MKPWALLLATGLPVILTAAGFAAEVARFSQALATAERTAVGLPSLSSDHVAVLDALVRRDAAAQAAPRRDGAPPLPARFSERLTADERRNAGLALLTAAELIQLDAAVDRSTTASLARTLLAPPAFIPLSVRARVAETQSKTAPEIHGSFTLGMGFGKGYSERFGGMTLTYEDPARNLAVSFSYSETHVKGAPGAYYLRDPLYDAGRLPRFSPEP